MTALICHFLHSKYVFLQNFILKINHFYLCFNSPIILRVIQFINVGMAE